MKLENGKIVEATEMELISYWLSRGYDDIINFDTYKFICEKNGTKIIECKEN